MFSKYGEVDEISRSSDATNPQLSRLWVTFGSYREASAAIEALNGTKIDEAHQIKVAIALSDEELAKRKQQKMEEEAFATEMSQAQVS